MRRIFYHPSFNVVAGIFGIVGTVLAIYFYYQSAKEPNLTYYISPTRTAIVQKGNLENFSVTFLGNKIQGDLSSAQIQIWNQGRAAIHNENILKPITLRTPNGEPIYQISAKTTRDVTGFMFLATSNALRGVLTMDWRIFEHNDGVKLQIIYGGSVNLPLIVDGTIEGQKKSITIFLSEEMRFPYHLYQQSTAYFWQYQRRFCLFLYWSLPMCA